MKKESFEDYMVRTGYKLQGAQGVNGAEYDIKLDGTVRKRTQEEKDSGLFSAGGGQGYKP